MNKLERETLRRQEQFETERFRLKLAKDQGVEGHPKEPELWKLAWDYGHSSGYNEVQSYYIDLVELLR